MERYASTFATTAGCVGLLLAGHLAIARDRPAMPDFAAVRMQHAARIATAEAVRAEAVRADTVRAWATPPAKSETPPADGALAARPAPAPEQAAAPPVQHTALRPEKARHPAEPARRRLSKARKMQVASRGLAADEAPARPEAAAPAAPAPERRIDPIGDLLRGLGIGREG